MTNDQKLLFIALRDDLSVNEVLLLLTHWVAPIVWEMGRVLDMAYANDPSWHAWRAHHDELVRLGYYAKG